VNRESKELKEIIKKLIRHLKGLIAALEELYRLL